MDENTAWTLARLWLSAARESEELAFAIAVPLQRAVPEPGAHAITEDKRLAMLDKEQEHLYVAGMGR